MAREASKSASSPRRAGPMASAAGGGRRRATSGRPGPPALAEPPRRHTGRLIGLMLGGCLLLAAIPLVAMLHGPPAVGTAESEALQRSSASWHHIHRTDEPSSPFGVFDAVAPIRGETAALDQPPGRVWLDLLAFGILAEPEADASALRYAARWVSVLAGLIAVAAIFWAGFAIAGPTTGSLAALVTAATPMFLYHGRLATATMPLTAAGLLAVAAALWAMRPFRPRSTGRREAIGWALAGLALAAVMFLGGTGRVLTVAAALATVVLLCPRRPGHLLGLAAAVGLAALTVAPWLLYVQQNAPGAWGGWLGAGLPGSTPGLVAFIESVGRRSLLLAVATLPWSIWLGAGLYQPFATRSATRRGRRRLAWGWFAALGVLFLAGAGGPASAAVVLLLPVGGLLAAQVFHELIGRSAEGRHTRLWRYGRWGQIALLGLGSLALPAALASQPTLIDWGLIHQPMTAPVAGLAAGMMATVLLAIVALSVRFAWRHHPRRAAICWAVWTATAMMLVVANGGV